MLHTIQSEIKAPKGQFNSFGKYKYRSCEDIVEAVKPVINKHGYYLTMTDEIIQVGERFYIKATATISNGTLTFSASAFAREEEQKKGMDGAQVTGAASSYARKYALNGLFAIDDTKDADATNTHDKPENKPKAAPSNSPDEGERNILRNLAYSADLTPDEKERALAAIDLLNDYETYQKIQFTLEDRQPGFDNVTNPSQKDINKKVKQIVKS